MANTTISLLKDFRRTTHEHKIELIPDEKLSEHFRYAKNNDANGINILIKQNTISSAVLYDTLFVAIICNSHDITEIILDQKIDFNENSLVYDMFHNTSVEKFTLMGLSIHFRRTAVIKLLLKYGYNIDFCFKNTNHKLEYRTGLGAVSTFLENKHCDSTSDNTELLSVILAPRAWAPSAGAPRAGAQNLVINTNKINIFNLAIWTSYAEFELLMNAGIDVNTIYKKEYGNKLKKDGFSYYSPEVNILDLVIMKAEINSIYPDKNMETIKKFELLLSKNTDTNYSHNRKNCGFLHILTIPKMMEIFIQNNLNKNVQMDLNQSMEYEEKSAYNKLMTEQHYTPIEIAHNMETINLLVNLGADKEMASYLPHSQRAIKNFERIGFDTVTKNHLNGKGILFLLDTFNYSDLSSLLSLIGAGIDINKSGTSDGKWTIMHHLFADIFCGHVSDELDFIDMAKRKNLKWINILIKHGAVPLKDKVGRTPLMCVGFNDTIYANMIIKQYAKYEADYHGVNEKIYLERLLKLRNGGYKSQSTLCGLGPSVAVPMQNIFDQFWNSFADGNINFNPEQSHDPVAEWNKLFD